MSANFRTSIGSHAAAIAVGAFAATAYLTASSASPQSLADYISAICAKSFGSAPAAEAPYLAENVSAMTKMMVDMGIRPSGDVDADFVAMMVPHHQGAIEMAQAELRHGHNEPLRRMAQGIHRHPAARDHCDAVVAGPTTAAFRTVAQSDPARCNERFENRVTHTLVKEP
ncbi:MAG: DUF305 domain-containing protein [Xanthobacteraceae bacterium]